MIYGIHYVINSIPFSELKVGDILYANPVKNKFFAYAEIIWMGTNLFGKNVVNYRYFSSMIYVENIKTARKSKTYPVLPFRKEYYNTEYDCFANYGKIVMLAKTSGHPATNLFL